MTTAGPWDLGDIVRLTTSAVDASGAAVNCATMALTVTLPDGSTAQPAVTNPPTAGTGQYSVDYPSVQAGHHKARWVGTGPAFAYTDVFDVTAADPRYLLSLADARQALRKVNGAVADDAELRLYMAAVTPIVEDITGPLVLTTTTWTVNGGKTSILLPTPVLAVTSVTENGTALIENQDFIVDRAAGIIYRGTQLQPYQFLFGVQNIVVTYTAGANVVADNVRLAARIILKHLWEADNTGRRPSLGEPGAAGDVTTTPGGFAIPRRALELLTPAFTSPPGFA